MSGAVPLVAAAAQLHLAAARHGVRLDCKELARLFFVNAERVAMQRAAHRRALVAAAAQACSARKIGLCREIARVLMGAGLHVSGRVWPWQCTLLRVALRGGCS